MRRLGVLPWVVITRLDWDKEERIVRLNNQLHLTSKQSWQALARVLRITLGSRLLLRTPARGGIVVDANFHWSRKCEVRRQCVGGKKPWYWFILIKTLSMFTTFQASRERQIWPSATEMSPKKISSKCNISGLLRWRFHWRRCHSMISIRQLINAARSEYWWWEVENDESDEKWVLVSSESEVGWRVQMRGRLKNFDNNLQCTY